MDENTEKNNRETAQALLEFIKKGTSPFHVVNESEQLLNREHFIKLELHENWQLETGKNYRVTIFGSTLFAFRVGENPRSNLRIASAHTDFPNLRIKPNPNVKNSGYISFNVEGYGGLILSTWLDRPLSIAGKVVIKGENPFSPKTVLIDFKRPLLTIPNLAIHMNRAMNEGVALNKQKDMLPLSDVKLPESLNENKTVLDEAMEKEVQTALREIDLYAELAKLAGCDKEDILFYELGLYPSEEGCFFGFAEEFISSPRIDNLTSVKACLEGLIKDNSKDGIHLIALFDNEEVGSRTKQGAASTILGQVLERIYAALGYSVSECYEDCAGGFMLSADVAHALHPNHKEKNDITNMPILNNGVAIKFASTQSYAGDAEAVSVVKALCQTGNIPCQMYVNRSDLIGGSTLGSIASAMVPMRTMDIGVPMLAMHSARETMGMRDQSALEALMKEFFNYKL